MNRALYPKDWEFISREIRYGRAKGRCECTGECGQHHGQRCLEMNHQPAKWATGRIILTTAHLCDCFPLCGNYGHLRAMCQKCHLRTDMARHSLTRRATIASPSYRAQRFRRAAREKGFEALAGLWRLPAYKRNGALKFSPNPSPQSPLPQKQ